MDFATDFKTIAPVPFSALLGGQQRDQEQTPQEEGRRAFLSRVHQRRFACLKAAADAIEMIPQEGESVHLIMTGFYDLMHLLVVLLERFGSTCECMRIGSLSLSRRNCQEMSALLDQGKVRQLDLLCSDFFRKHDDDIFAELVKEFHERGQRVAAARSHCKLVSLLLADGRKYTLEGSPNLRTNRNAENLCITQDAGLWGWLDQWLDTMVREHEVK